MIQYEVTFIVDPVLSGDEIKATAQTYVDLIKSENGEIVHVDEMGLRQLAYPLNKRTSGVYFCVEFKVENGVMIAPLELALRRDERIMRFLSVRLDKYGVKYNEDKRNGLIGSVKKRSKKIDDKDKRRGDRDRNDRNERGGDRNDRNDRGDRNRGPKKEAAAAAPVAPAPAPVAPATATKSEEEE